MSIWYGLLLLLPAGLAAPAPWSQRTLEQFRRVRAGEWHGSGFLYKASGERVAAVECLEVVEPLPAESSSEAVLSMERLLLYREIHNGTLMTTHMGQTVTPLRYKHNVMLALDNSRGVGQQLRMLAFRQDGADMARGRAHCESERVGWFARALRLRVSVTPPQPRGRPGASVSEVCKEEYRLISPCAGMAPKLHYRRTGRCPSWCGSGACTLEITSRKRWQFWPHGQGSSQISKSSIAAHSDANMPKGRRLWQERLSEVEAMKSP